MLSLKTTPFAVTRASLAEKFANAVDKGTRNDALRSGVGRLGTILESPLLVRFEASLAQLHEPHHRMKDAIKSAREIIRSAPVEGTDAACRRATKAFAVAFDAIFGADVDGTRSGAYASEYLDKVAGTLRAAIGGTASRKRAAGEGPSSAWARAGFGAGDSLTKGALTKLSQFFSAQENKKPRPPLLETGSGVSNHVTRKPSLGLYSNWLASYDGSAQLEGDGIEVPGIWARYATAFERPRVEAHPTVVCFNPTLLLMASKQAPKRIRVILSDGATKHYLVKGGEDVRQDQRIQR